MHRRLPSAPLVISVIALFVALGGVGYAATQLPKASVGSAQLRTFAVTNPKLANNIVGSRKIMDGAVGRQQINTSQVQERVTGTCSNLGQAIGAISSAGHTTCAQALPKEFGTNSSQSTVAPGSGTTQIVSKTLPSGSPYLAFGIADATVSASGTMASLFVKVTCALSPGGSATAQSRSVTVHVAGTTDEQLEIPFVLPIASSTSDALANIACSYTSSGTGTAAVNVQASLNALQTASNS